MLAYTTITDIVQLPSALEAVVYLTGLVIVLIGPYLFFSLMDKFSAVTNSSKKSTHSRR